MQEGETTQPDLSAKTVQRQGQMAPELEQVTLRLRWQHQFQFAGYYAALWQGYYEEEQIEVNILPGIDSDGHVYLSTDEVAQGRSDFGVGASDILLKQAKGADLQIVASFFQKSAVSYTYLPSTPFYGMADFVRRNTARREQDLLDIELQAMLLTEGIQPAIDEPLPKDTQFSYDSLATGVYEIVPQYLGTIAWQAMQEGVRLEEVRPVAYGIDFYGDSLFVSGKLAEENPELVERFRKATVKGWQYALEHEEEIAKQIVETYYPKTPDPQGLIRYQLYQAEQVRALLVLPIVELGNVNPFRWQVMADTLHELQLLEEPLEVESYIFDWQKIDDARMAQQVKVYKYATNTLLIALVVAWLMYLVWKNAHLQEELNLKQQMADVIRQSNERYMRMFDASFLGITVTDRAGVILQCNDKWAEITGYSVAALTGKSIFEIVTPESVQAGKDRFKALRCGDIQALDMEREYIRQDGSRFWGNLYMTAIHDPEIENQAFLGMVLDITERRLEQQAVRRAETLMLHQSRLAAMGETIASIAHQWRQPLNSLLMILRNLSDSWKYDDLTDEAFDRSVDRSRELIKGMSQTIDDFREFVDPNPDEQAFSLRQVLQGAVDLFCNSTGQQTVRFALHMEQDVMLRGKKNHLSQVFFNLIHNSFDALKGQSNGLIELWVASGVNGMVSIQVRDNGRGIPDGVQDRLFEPYVSTKSKREGTGLGLHIAKTVIESHFDGVVQLVKSSEAGTIFEVCLPEGVVR